MVSFSLNGSDVTVGDHPHLLAALREELDVTSPKDGCAPSGQCGCCTVLLDGKATVSCNLSLAQVEGRLRLHRGAAVRLLHTRHRAARQVPARQQRR